VSALCVCGHEAVEHYGNEETALENSGPGFRPTKCHAWVGYQNRECPCGEYREARYLRSANRAYYRGIIRIALQCGLEALWEAGESASAWGRFRASVESLGFEWVDRPWSVESMPATLAGECPIIIRDPEAAS